MDIDRLIDDAFKQVWYYTVELRNGEFTQGFEGFNYIALTRKAIGAVDVKSKKVLDISTMEGMFPVLMSRRGATVMATDVGDAGSKVRLLQNLYDVSFDYRPETPVQNYVEDIFALQSLRNLGDGRHPIRCSEVDSAFGFDVVLSSGLLYHVNNPVDHLLNYRRLCKTDGVCVIETACILSNHIEMAHDLRDGSQSYGGIATWFPSSKALEVYLKACFFEPLGFVYLSHSAIRENLARIAIVARAVDERPFSSSDQEIIKGSELYKNYDYAPLYLSGQLTGKCRTAPSVNLDDLHDADDLSGDKIRSYPELEYEDSDLMLKLSDL